MQQFDTSALVYISVPEHYNDEPSGVHPAPPVVPIGDATGFHLAHYGIQVLD